MLDMIQKRDTAIYDEDLGLFTYARLKDGRFLSSGLDLSRSALD